MKYIKPLTVASLALGAALSAVLVPVIGNASGAEVASYHKAVVGPDSTFQCSDGCSLPGVLNVDPQGVTGPDTTDPTLRVGRWPRTIYISCLNDATGDGTNYLARVDPGHSAVSG
jgi:hypothetical protein